jgi:hypothetical protein
VSIATPLPRFTQLAAIVNRTAVASIWNIDFCGALTVLGEITRSLAGLA